MIDLTKYVLGVDVWDGDGDPDWAVLWANGVRYVMIRMNQSDGSLVLDRQFHNWPAAGAVGMARGAYVVINPKYSRRAYVDWILGNLPADCRVVAPDVEIKGGTSQAYAELVGGILGDLKMAAIHPLNYSGPWFFQYLTPWPKGFDQWWARYPTVLYPEPPAGEHGTHVTWDVLKGKLTALDSFSPMGSYTFDAGHVAIWQCTSRYILPGGPKEWPLDVNLMPVADFDRIFGGKVQPPDLTMAEKVDRLWGAHPELW